MSVVICRKPDDMSWDQIHDILWLAHSANRERGLSMKYPSLLGEELRKKFESNSSSYIALCDGKLIGTSTLWVKDLNLWCGKGDYGYCCLAAVLPQYQGKGVYKSLNEAREKEALSLGVKRMMFDTHELNFRVINVAKKNGYRPVGVCRYGDHYNVVMVKWLDGCPYSLAHCYFRFFLSKVFCKYLKRL